jgi:hypothetical protein
MSFSTYSLIWAAHLHASAIVKAGKNSRVQRGSYFRPAIHSAYFQLFFPLERTLGARRGKGIPFNDAALAQRFDGKRNPHVSSRPPRRLPHTKTTIQLPSKLGELMPTESTSYPERPLFPICWGKRTFNYQ